VWPELREFICNIKYRVVIASSTFSPGIMNMLKWVLLAVADGRRMNLSNQNGAGNFEAWDGTLLGKFR